MHGGHCGKNDLRVELVVGRSLLQLVREHVQQHFGIRIGVDVAQILAEHLLFQAVRIGEIAVVPQHDPERRIDIERLRFGSTRGRTGGGIAAVGNAHVAGQGAHVARVKHVAHQPSALVHVEGLPF